MALETKSMLNQETIEKLQDLIQCNIDSRDGFREAADEIKNDDVAALFRDLGAQRDKLATELQTHVEWSGERAERDGSFAASLHRTWINLRSKLNGGDAYPILCEAERGEDHIKEAYEDSLKCCAGSAMNSILQDQYAQVKAGHDRVRDLRDAFKK